MVLRLIAAALLFAFPAAAHRGEAARVLRLQIAGDRLEGLLQFTLPPGREAQRLLAAPPALALGDPIAAHALRGLQLSVGPDETALRPARVRIVEANARRTRTGGVDAMLLIAVDEPLPIPTLIELSSSERVRATLGAPAGFDLSLAAGVGRPVKGGLALRPRADRPCRVRIARSR